MRFSISQKRISHEEQQIMTSQDNLVPTLVTGAIAGFVATFPMTAVMELMHRDLPWWQRYPLPPSQIVNKIASAVGLRQHMDKSQHSTMTVIAHFAYGAAAGALYAPLANRAPLPAPLKGSVAGLIVWGSSYLGLLPAMGILPPATEHPRRRTALMIAAHLVWGVATGVVADRIGARHEQSHGGTIDGA
jgi:putative membrane protein